MNDLPDMTKEEKMSIRSTAKRLASAVTAASLSLPC